MVSGFSGGRRSFHCVRVAVDLRKGGASPDSTCRRSFSLLARKRCSCHVASCSLLALLSGQPWPPPVVAVALEPHGNGAVSDLKGACLSWPAVATAPK